MAERFWVEAKSMTYTAPWGEGTGTYNGQVQGGRMDGKGVLFYGPNPNAWESHEGSWKHGQAHGMLFFTVRDCLRFDSISVETG